jgi:aryl-alcohol dehydrogenase-like predicted oxidoreductase
MERRDFLRCAAAGIGATVVGGGRSRTLAAEPTLERRNERPGMTYVRLGRTNLAVSRIAHGSVHTNRDRIPVLAKLYEAGVNLYDTSHVYGGGKAEDAFGEFFADAGRRKNVFICTKMNLIPQLKGGQGVYEKAMALAEASLKRLRTDYVDIMMLHGCSTLIDWVENPEWLRAAEDLRKQGKIRFIGISEHTKPAEVLQRAAACGRYDCAMVAFSLVKGEWAGMARTDMASMDPGLKAAKEKDLGIVAMKAAMKAEEMLAKATDPKLKAKGYSPYQLCYRYILGVPGVHSVACGMTTLPHVAENLAVPSIELAASEWEHLRQAAAASGVCGFCGTCMRTCPAGLPVQDILRFHGYWTHGHVAAAREQYAALAPHEQSPACRDCGRCEAACPGRVAIRQRLRAAHAALS